MKNYELSYLISPDSSTEEAEALNAGITSYIQKEGGLILKSEVPVSKFLGYTIKKQRSALWVNIEFSTEPEKIALINDYIKKETKVLRYLLVIKKPKRQVKERRERKEQTPAPEIEKQEKVVKSEKSDKKVDIQDIDEKLNEILGE
jgi:ribosomal protein S6